ncbi:hypothetical protein FACS189454_08340 [Planctomycetales bacterium]|nr:hypothetical protein FACS189454_08340 [Planctomycetales bacterium]
MQHSQRGAAGLSVPATEQSTFAGGKVTLQRLVEPLQQFVKQQTGTGYILRVFDWCQLAYTNHSSKHDRIRHPLKDSTGYDLTAQLAVSADTGSPMALVQSHLKTAHGFLSTVDNAPVPGTNHLDQVLPMMRAVLIGKRRAFLSMKLQVVL